jgi:hypothetical protein
MLVECVARSQPTTLPRGSGMPKTATDSKDSMDAMDMKGKARLSLVHFPAYKNVSRHGARARACCLPLHTRKRLSVSLPAHADVIR